MKRAASLLACLTAGLGCTGASAESGGDALRYRIDHGDGYVIDVARWGAHPGGAIDGMWPAPIINPPPSEGMPTVLSHWVPERREYTSLDEYVVRRDGTVGVEVELHEDPSQWDQLCVALLRDYVPPPFPGEPAGFSAVWMRPAVGSSSCPIVPAGDPRVRGGLGLNITGDTATIVQDLGFDEDVVGSYTLFIIDMNGDCSYDPGDPNECGAWGGVDRFAITVDRMVREHFVWPSPIIDPAPSEYMGEFIDVAMPAATAGTGHLQAALTYEPSQQNDLCVALFRNYAEGPGLGMTEFTDVWVVNTGGVGDACDGFMGDPRYRGALTTSVVSDEIRIDQDLGWIPNASGRWSLLVGDWASTCDVGSPDGCWQPNGYVMAVQLQLGRYQAFLPNVSK